MTVVICPGIHDPKITDSFLAGLRAAKTAQVSSPPFGPDHPELSLGKSPKTLVFPSQESPAYSAIHILEFLRRHCSIDSPLLLVCFSAGVAGSMGAALGWQQFGGKIRALLALDGWGVPLYGDFPIHRLSHDQFTDWSSKLLGEGRDSFYADPSVEHLALWRSPQNTQGWWLDKHHKQKTTAALFINLLLERYGESV
jgi:hypothetical protein